MKPLDEKKIALCGLGGIALAATLLAVGNMLNDKNSTLSQVLKAKEKSKNPSKNRKS